MRGVRRVVRPPRRTGSVDRSSGDGDGDRSELVVIVAAGRDLTGADNWIGLGVAIAVVVYLVIVVLFPERF